MSSPDTNPQQKQESDARASHERAVLDPTGEAWKGKQEVLIEKYESIIALRGAGTNNGIDKVAANKLVEEKLVPEIRKRLEKGSVAIMFDGDGDDLNKPDIGFIMGRLADAFKNEPKERVAFIAAQKQSWYDYAPGAKEGKNLANANGREYDTTVFPDGVFAGDHNSFTQSEVLANSDKYEQWYVGASGPIASEQLGDLNNKVKGGSRKVLMIPAPVNEELSASFETKLTQAQAELAEAEGQADEEATKKARAKVQKFEDVITQRKNKYGVHYSNDGELSVDTSDYPNLSFEVVK